VAVAGPHDGINSGINSGINGNGIDYGPCW
jgi:hypothetical protein